MTSSWTSQSPMEFSATTFVSAGEQIENFKGIGRTLQESPKNLGSGHREQFHWPGNWRGPPSSQYWRPQWSRLERENATDISPHQWIASKTRQTVVAVEWRWSKNADHNKTQMTQGKKKFERSTPKIRLYAPPSLPRVDFNFFTVC